MKYWILLGGVLLFAAAFLMFFLSQVPIVGALIPASWLSGKMAMYGVGVFMIAFGMSHKPFSISVIIAVIATIAFAVVYGQGWLPI